MSWIDFLNEAGEKLFGQWHSAGRDARSCGESRQLGKGEGATRAAPRRSISPSYRRQLSKISKQGYGDPSRYMTIFEANKPMLSNPDRIYPGQNLRVSPE